MDVRFTNAFDQATRTNRKSGFERFKGQAIVEALIICVTVFTFYYFALPDVSQHFTLGAYAAITELVAMVLSALSSCSEGIFSIREFSELRTELWTFFDEAEEGTMQNTSNLPSNVLLSFEDVCFQYPDCQNNAVANLSFQFQRAKHYGLVGVNGAGKTTLSKLLLGLYTPTSGHVKTSAISATALFQDFQIYPVTVREYLLMGNRSDIPDDKLISVLSELGCTDLKNGLDTPLTLITEAGSLLSRGQLQKLAVARIFLSDAEFIILDEPTASLDPVSEREVYLQALRILRDRTTLFISHRLGAVSGMDEILVLYNGLLCGADNKMPVCYKIGELRCIQMYSSRR